MLCAQSQQAVVKDLRDEWLITENNSYRKFDGVPSKAVFFSVDATRFKNDFLQVEDDEPFVIFINKKLVVAKERGSIRYGIDSLSALYSPLLQISIFQKGGISSLSCNMLAPSVIRVSDEDPIPRTGNFFLDFSLMGTLIVSLYFILLLRSNPRLTLDYLNASKLFSVQEREENLLANRVASSVNLLFYLFCSLFCGLTLTAVFHFAGDLIPLAEHFPIRSIGEGFLQWSKLSMLIAGLLVLKMVIVFTFSMLFNLKDTAAIQYFNFIRVLFVVAGFIAFVSTLHLIFYGQYGSLQSFLLRTGAVVMVLSAGMMYLKLLALTRYHFFHLFSYLCASEIIPLVILLKVLLY